MRPSLTWPVSRAAGPLGDGLNATERVRPESIEALCAVVPELVSKGLAIYPQGGGTALDYGSPPERPGAALELGGLDRIVDYPHADMTVTVEAGTTLGALQALLAKEGQFLPIDAPFPETATLGGIWATNFSGPRRFGWGRPRDLIIGVSFVNAAGHVVKGGGRVVKNVAGYDFPKLLTGSMGTLGAIVQMTLKVRPRPGGSALAWVPLHDLASVAHALKRLNLSQTRPVAVEWLNRPAAEAVARPLGLPIGSNDQHVLVLGFEDNAESVRWQVEQRLPLELGTHHFVTLRDEGAVPLWTGLTQFAEGPGAVGLVATVVRSGVAPLMEALDPERWAVQAHAGSGILRALSRSSWNVEDVANEVARLRAKAAEYEGAIVVASAPTAWKRRLNVWGPPREDWVLAKAVKAALDPQRVFNPGRFVAGT